MQFVRRIAVGLASFLLPITVFWFGIGFSAWQVFSGPKHIEGALQKSGLYSSVVKDVLKQQGKNNGDLPVDQPQIRALVQQSFTPQLLQETSTLVLDSTFAWLQGKTATPNFQVDLTGAKNSLADGVGNYVDQRISSLPICSLDAIPQNVDVFTTPCVPPGFSKAQAVEKARQTVLASEAFSKPVLTNNTFKSDDGQLLSQKFEQLPQRYHQLKQGLYMLAIISVLAAVIIIFLHVTRRNGLRRVARVLLGAGLSTIVMAITIAVIAQLVSSKITTTPGSNQALAKQIVEVAHLLVNDVRTWWLGYGICIAVVGGVGLIALKLSTPKGVPKIKPPIPVAKTPKKSPPNIS
jgi:hypothetical protein